MPRALQSVNADGRVCSLTLAEARRSFAGAVVLALRLWASCVGRLARRATRLAGTARRAHGIWPAALHRPVLDRAPTYGPLPCIGRCWIARRHVARCLASAGAKSRRGIWPTAMHRPLLKRAMARCERSELTRPAAFTDWSPRRAPLAAIRRTDRARAVLA